MLDGTLQCAACGEPIPRTSKLQDDGTHICPRCGARVDALPRFLGAGQGRDGGERTDDPITMPAIPASAFEPAVPVAFTGRHRWKPRKGGPAFADVDAGEPQEEDDDEGLRPDPTPAYERVSHEIEAPAPPPVMRADSIPPIPDDAIAPVEEAPTPVVPRRSSEGLEPPKVRPPRGQNARHRGADDPPEFAGARPPPEKPRARPVPEALPDDAPTPGAPPIRAQRSAPPRAEPPRAAPRAEPQRAEPERPEPHRPEPPVRARTEPVRPPVRAAPAVAPRTEPRRAEPVTPHSGGTASGGTPSRAPSRGVPAAAPPPMQASPPSSRSVEAPAQVAPAPVDDGSEPYTVTEAGGALVVEWRWFGVGAILLGLVASCWTGLLTGWLAVAGYLASAGGGWLLIAILGGGVHLVLALAVCYVAVAWFVNRTRVRASPTGLDVSVGPVPWGGSRTVPLASIARLVLTERTAGSTKSYEVSAALVHGGQVTVVRGIRELAEAKRLEERVARNLGNPLLRVGAKTQPPGSGGDRPSMVTPQSDAGTRKKTG